MAGWRAGGHYRPRFPHIGSFEFLLTPAANAKLDKEWLVIGQIMEPEGMQLLARLNSLPTNNYDQTPIVLVKVERAVPLPSGGKA